MHDVTTCGGRRLGEFWDDSHRVSGPRRVWKQLRHELAIDEIARPGAIAWVRGGDARPFVTGDSPRQRKKVPVARQPLVKPIVPNEVHSADFVFDRTAEGRVLKCMAIVDDATTEAVAIIPARTLGGLAVTRATDRLAATRGLQQVLRTDNGLECCAARC